MAEVNGDGTLSIDVEPLRKILQLEQKKGYLDSAVIGGLDKFLSNWVGRAMESSTDPHLLKRFQRLHPPDSSYASLTRQQRKKWVNDLFDFLGQMDNRGGGGTGLAKNRIDALPIVSDHSFLAGQLPMHHRDPFDRMLVAQAQAENMEIVSNDHQISLYDVNMAW